MTPYAKSDDLAAFITNETVTAVLTPYAKSDDLAAFVTNEAVAAILTPYTKPADLTSNLTVIDSMPYAKTTDLMFIASKTADLTTLVRIACVLVIVLILIVAILM